MPFVNMTPHALKVFTGNGDNPGEVLSLPPSGQSVRVAQSFEPAGAFEGVSLYEAVYGDIETIDNATKEVVVSRLNGTFGLPPEVKGTIYIVSGQALEAVKSKGRTDFAAPGELLRDANGQPTGCNGLRV